MSYYPKNETIYAFNNNSVAFDVGSNKDSYSVQMGYYHNVQTDEIIYKAEVVKNWHYNEVPKSGPITGQKYKEILSSGTPKQCMEFIHIIVKAQGYWDQHPTKPFEKIFIEPSQIG